MKTNNTTLIFAANDTDGDTAVLMYTFEKALNKIGIFPKTFECHVYSLVNEKRKKQMEEMLLASDNIII